MWTSQRACRLRLPYGGLSRSPKKDTCTRFPPRSPRLAACSGWWMSPTRCTTDRKSTRLNSSHRCISYAVFCLKKKKKTENKTHSNDKEELHIMIVTDTVRTADTRRK